MANIFPTHPPQYGARNDMRPRTRSVQFDDGYEMRFGAGLNTLAQRWSLQWTVPLAVAEHLDTFIAGHRGYVWFWWTPPRQTSPIKVICKEWTRSPTEGSRTHDTLTATFQQVFDLAG